MHAHDHDPVPRARAVSWRTRARYAAVLFAFGCACSSLESRTLSPPGTAGAAGETPSATGGGAGTKAHPSSGGSAHGGGDQTGSGGGEDGASCGDGQRDGDESCDDGNLEPGDGCSASCGTEPSSPACGDGDTAGTEACDDGNLQPGDGCDERCRVEACGNDRIDKGEECEPPNVDRCTARCILVTSHCGDGKVQKDEDEQCDDANDTTGDGCSDCRRECGDGRIDRSIGEDCEPEYSDHCSTQCEWLPACGDGEIQAAAGEECDPSNGTTCVDCQVTTPPCDEGEECGGPTDCVPTASSDLVQNGAFATGISGWSAPSSLVELRPVDDGSPEPKALEVEFDAGPVRAVSGAYQCIPIEPGASYELVAKYRIPNEAPYGVGASVTTALYAGTRCDGTPVGAPSSGPTGEARDEWTPYGVGIDASALPAGGAARLFLRLNVVRPANAVGSRVRWDSVSIAAPERQCGDCDVDDGETCDDGNRADGDGCTADCELELCGDGEQTAGEACDDGSAAFEPGDSCTPSCQPPTSCDLCSLSECVPEGDACLRLDGTAEAGPEAGRARSTLCDALRVCVRESGCDLAVRKTAGVQGAYLENCYCGTSGDRCFDTARAANGSCKREVEAALETTDAGALLGRLGGANEEFPSFEAVKQLLACENATCGADCAKVPACGNGYEEDRNLEFTFVVEGHELDCRDDLTATGRGCSFEECDDGNLEPGDGCDAHCFLEACGNNVLQAGEGCDDGNVSDGDGCSATCQPEYDCGNGVREELHEECDPPSGGHVCTEAEYASDPTGCGCDTDCKRLVCGNGMVQRPEEDCDPPNGFSCGDDCKSLNQDACEACINSDPYYATVNATYCNPDPLCVAVKQCVVQSGCPQSPSASPCYCGSNLEDCDLPEFVPTGPCVDEIRSGAGENPTNEQVLNRLLTFGEYPTSTALALLRAVAVDSDLCRAECAPTLP